jgi:hypothetical protein
VKRVGNSRSDKLRKRTRRKVAPGFFVPGFLSLEIVIFSRGDTTRERCPKIVRGLWYFYGVGRLLIDRGSSNAKEANR